jgi:hypothetical protein
MKEQIAHHKAAFWHCLSLKAQAFSLLEQENSL